ncbi:MAG: hypothetical protein IKE63_04570 [Bacilli bacterium]|nr:hypothetical protein [Bacilli bacterium]
MKRILNIRNNIIIVLCVTIILMAIGFIAISIELKTYRDKEESFNVVFRDISKQSSVKGSSKEPLSEVSIDSSGKIINMKFSLFAAHDELTYKAIIKNNGTLPAKIVKVLRNPDYDMEAYKKLIHPVTITTSDIEGKSLSPGEELEYKMVIYYNPSINNNVPKNFSYNIALITESN